MRLHELLMDMITEHNYGVPIPLSHDDHSSHMDDIHTEMEKRLIVFLALPGIIFQPFHNNGANHKTISIRFRSLNARKFVQATCWSYKFGFKLKLSTPIIISILSGLRRTSTAPSSWSFKIHANALRLLVLFQMFGHQVRKHGRKLGCSWRLCRRERGTQISRTARTS